MAGELLYKSGYVGKEYINGMLAREQDVSTYMGRGIAIPHGENAVKDTVKKSGIVVLQFPNGVEFGTGKAKLVVGIAGKGDEHLAILANIAIALDEYTDEQLEEAVSWCNNLFGLKFDAVNNDVEETLQRYAPTLELRNQLSATRKIYADVYIDDRNLNADEYLEKNLILLDAKSLYDMGITENATEFLIERVLNK